jgi:TPR repeat protein
VADVAKANRLEPPDDEIIRRARDAYKRKHFEQAAYLYSLVAEKGHRHSQIFMGWLCSEGVGVPRDFERAKLWFQRAALAGSFEGMFYLGRLLTAEGDHTLAFQWYRRAAALGYAPAHFRMGEAYARGLGVAPDIRLALDQYHMGAKAGHIFAQRALALRDATGKEGWQKMPLGVLKLLFVVTYGLLLGVLDRHSERLKW